MVTNESLKGIEQSGFAGSGMLQIRIGLKAGGKVNPKKGMEELAKADSTGQKAKVKQLAAKMLKGL